jgi:predicted phosphodiesterase
MKRRDFVGNVAIGSLLGAAATTSTYAQQALPSPASRTPQRGDSLMITPVSLMAPTADGVTAIWGVSELCKGRIQWQDADGNQGVATADPFGMVPQGTAVIRVRVTGLRPGHEYRLQAITTSGLRAHSETSGWKTFRTLDSAASTTRFVVWNDTHVHNETIARLDDVTPPADFLIWNGDTCNDWTKDELLIPTLLNPGERDITDKRPLMLIWGNHDVRGAWAFQLPQMVATPNDRPFYAFRSGPVAAICLHTGEDKPDDHPSFSGRVAFDQLRKEQTAWLEETIAQPMFRDAPYRIVFCHIPLRWTTERIPDYAKGGYDHYSHRSRLAWHDSLVRWKTQVVISGHTHQHAWIPADDRFPYAQLTGGGPKLAQATWIDAVATEESLTIQTHLLDGGQGETVRFTPVG